MKSPRKSGLMLAAGSAVAGVLLAGTGVAGASTSSQVTYTLATPVSIAQCVTDIPPCAQTQGYDYQGAGENLAPTPPLIFPVGGAFHLVLTATKFAPTDPCRMTQGTGTLDVTWGDGTTSTGTYAFKAHDSKTFALKGTITGGTNNAFLNAALGGLAAMPTDPCVGGPVGPSTLTFVPPTPI
jgi:hypothetical protein